MNTRGVFESSPIPTEDYNVWHDTVRRHRRTAQRHGTVTRRSDTTQGHDTRNIRPLDVTSDQIVEFENEQVIDRSWRELCEPLIGKVN